MNVHKSFTSAIIGLGANLPGESGSTEATLRQALRDLEHERLVVQNVSPFYATPCFPAGSGPEYVNAVAVVQTDCAPRDFLSHLHLIEARHGRSRQERWGARVLDLDLLAMEERVAPDDAGLRKWMGLSPDRQRRDAPDQLILPHPRLQDRAFVLVPMNDVAPDWRHPVLKRTVAQMLARLDPGLRAEVRRL